jgi:hypothetical protein
VGAGPSIGAALPTTTHDTALKAAIELFEGCPLDGYDIFYVNAIQNARLDAVVTDDIKSSTFPPPCLHRE